MGPRATLTTLARQQAADPAKLVAVPTLGDSAEVDMNLAPAWVAEFASAYAFASAFASRFRVRSPRCSGFASCFGCRKCCTLMRAERG